jgi:hypothetical protein
MRYDLLTQKANRIFTENDNEYNSHLAIYKDKLFSRKCSFINLEFGTYSSYTCNLDGSDIQKTFDIDQESVFLADRHYLYSNVVDIYGSIKTADEWGGELRKHFSKERCSQTAMPFFAVFELYFGLFLSPVQNQMHR